jgi:copper resistance protein B
MKSVAFFLLFAAVPAYAQHSGHQMPMPTPSAEQPTDPASQSQPKGMTGEMDHSQMDHSQTDHSQMSHDSMPGMDHGDMAADAPIPEGPPPPEAFEGPLHAGIPGVDAKVMNSSRIQVMREVSGMPIAWLQFDRAELRIKDGRNGYLWDAQGFYGGDIDKAWFKSEGEGAFGEKIESAEVQGLWSHAITPWFDLQTGVRQDLAGPARTYAVVGVQGLAPYLFDVDAAAFLSNKGDITARIEAELDQRITQRLILQPRAEIRLSAQDVPELRIGAGLDRGEVGLRLRYEITRQFAPYVGVHYGRAFGTSRRLLKDAGESAGGWEFLAGIRTWF